MFPVRPKDLFLTASRENSKQIEKSTATYTKEQAEIRSKVQGMQSVMMQSMKQAQQQQAQA